jgi:hypothetical protein
MVQSAIRLECILTDDDCLDTVFTAGKASGHIDFSAYLQVGVDVEGGADLVRYMSADEGLYSRSDLDDMVIEIHAVPASGTVADIIKITLDSSASSHSYTSSTSPTVHSLTVGLNQDTDSNISEANTGAFMAQIIKEAISDVTAITSLITPRVTAGFMDIDDEKGRLNLEMVNAGSVADFADLSITPAGDVDLPAFSSIIDNETNSCFSAGDKMQNLISVVVNNGVVGAVGGIDRLGGGVDFSIPDYFRGGSAPFDDYIVGLQIPYNSFNGIVDIYGATAENVPQSYSARNFFYGTGFLNRKKDATRNTRLASGDFDVKDRTSGIRGTVASIDFDYQAGETVYSATVTFQPLDLWGSL